MPTTKDPFAPIDPKALETVAGGAKRGSGDDELTAALTQITSSIKDLANQKNNNSMDPMQLMLMMLMFSGGGGGGGAGIAAPYGTAPAINVDANIVGGGKKKGKKGW